MSPGITHLYSSQMPMRPKRVQGEEMNIKKGESPSVDALGLSFVNPSREKGSITSNAALERRAQV
jgi:hypothetical protein